jgi:hypothetical protein
LHTEARTQALTNKLLQFVRKKDKNKAQNNDKPQQQNTLSSLLTPHSSLLVTHSSFEIHSLFLEFVLFS